MSTKPSWIKEGVRVIVPKSIIEDEFSSSIVQQASTCKMIVDRSDWGDQDAEIRMVFADGSELETISVEWTDLKPFTNKSDESDKPEKKYTETERKELAKKVRKALETLKKATEKAEEAGVAIDWSYDEQDQFLCECEMSFQPPTPPAKKY